MSAFLSDIPVLTTRRLVLRMPESRDHAAYARFFADAEASHFYGGPLAPHQAWDRLAADIGHFALRGFGRFVVTLDDQTIGGCGILDVDGWPGHELTWWLLPEARGKGIAQEASRAVLGWAGRSLGRPTVETHFRDENLAARRLTEGLGGVLLRRDQFPDGFDRDVYGIPTAQVAA